MTTLINLHWWSELSTNSSVVFLSPHQTLWVGAICVSGVQMRHWGLWDKRTCLRSRSWDPCQDWPASEPRMLASPGDTRGLSALSMCKVLERPSVLPDSLWCCWGSWLRLRGHDLDVMWLLFLFHFQSGLLLSGMCGIILPGVTFLVHFVGSHLSSLLSGSASLSTVCPHVPSQSSAHRGSESTFMKSGFIWGQWDASCTVFKKGSAL